MRRRSGVSVVLNKMQEHFGRRFREWMEERGVTLMQLAKDLNLSYTYLYSFGAPGPAGRLPGPENAMLIAEYLGVPREQFFAAMGQMDPLLLEEATPEQIEAGLIEAQKVIKRLLSGEMLVTEEEVREQKYLNSFRRIIKGLSEEEVEAILKAAKSMSESFRTVRKEETAKVRSG